MKNAPIGVFDSGYGGLTVLSEIRKRLPEYDYIYLGDNARTPYGTRSFDVVYNYTLEAVGRLFDMGCELIIIACNTASAKALRNIQQRDLEKFGSGKRVLGVIRPSTEIIGQYTTSRHVGIMGTEGTIRSESYTKEINKFFPDVTVVQEACPIWVPLIENNQWNTPGGHFFVKHHVDKLFKTDPKIDTIVLGCTHYPILKKLIETFVPDGLQVLAQGEIVARSLEDYLKRHPEMEEKLSKKGEMAYYTTENTKSFDRSATFFMGKNVHSEQITLA